MELARLAVRMFSGFVFNLSSFLVLCLCFAAMIATKQRSYQDFQSWPSFLQERHWDDVRAAPDSAMEACPFSLVFTAVSTAWARRVHGGVDRLG